MITIASSQWHRCGRASKLIGSMSTPCFHVDAFTDRPFTGNPAAVCLLDAPRPAKWMQAFAAEMNLSETAFLAPGKTHLQLRWFTPVAEVALCGHATLATAHVLWSEGIAPKKIDLRFATKSGVLTARQLPKGRIELDFPARPALQGKVAGAVLAKALGVKPTAVVKVADDVLVELASEAAVRGLAPDLAKLAKIDARGVIVTARGRKYDFVSRFFGPRVGVAEDPVTGSAHCALAPYWGAKLGKSELKGFQVSARGGEVECELVGERVLLRGSAVTVTRATILV